jgi:hypothetical protein
MMRELWDIEISELPPLDAISLQDLCVFLSQVSPLRDIDIVLRLKTCRIRCIVRPSSV